MLVFLVALAVTFATTLAIIRLASRVAHTHDHDVDGPQKFHVRAVPRIGGIGIVAGLCAALAVLVGEQRGASAVGAMVLLCGLPVLGFGLLEDVTKRVRPLARLAAAAVSAGLAFVLLDNGIVRTDLPGLDWIVSFVLGSALLTVFTVVGVSNSVNIIDGFNGLASMCVVLMLVGLAYVAAEVGDPLVLALALAGIGSVLGFFIWNFPAGLVFLGDGGAYFLGYYVAELALLLIARNDAVSPLFPLLLCFYPVFETLFSIYRRRVLHLRAVGLPDGVHLHSLIYRRLLRWAAGERTARELTRRNSMTSPYLWALCMLSVAPSTLFWDNSVVIGGFVVLFSAVYLALYWRIVRFRSPRLLRALRSRPLPPGAGDNRGR